MRRKKIGAIACVVLLGGTALTVIPRPSQADRASSQELSKPILPQPVVGSHTASQLRTLGRVYETHEKVINYTVSVPVYETHTKELNYTVMRPATETFVKEVHYTVIRTVAEEHSESNSDVGNDRIVKTVKQVPESKVKSISYTVTKMVPEQRTKTVVYRTCRFATETRQKLVQYTTCRFVPATTLQKELDQTNENSTDPMGSNRCLN